MKSPEKHKKHPAIISSKTQNTNSINLKNTQPQIIPDSSQEKKETKKDEKKPEKAEENPKQPVKADGSKKK